jgi:hypothetical protein
VIGQYFNQDEDESSGEEAETAKKPLLLVGAGKDATVSKPTVLMNKGRLPLSPEDEEEESSEEEKSSRISPPAKARIRPPASFFSMDFLEDPGDMMEWQEEEEEEKPLPPPTAKPKVKTELEIELEYKHILYGGKKRKGPKIGLGKKKKTTAVAPKSGSKETSSIIKQISAWPELVIKTPIKSKVTKGRKLKKRLKTVVNREKSADLKSPKTRRYVYV